MENEKIRKEEKKENLTVVELIDNLEILHNKIEFISKKQNKVYHKYTDEKLQIFKQIEELRIRLHNKNKEIAYNNKVDERISRASNTAMVE